MSGFEHRFLILCRQLSLVTSKPQINLWRYINAYPITDERITLKWSFEKWCGNVWNGFFWLNVENNKRLLQNCCVSNKKEDRAKDWLYFFTIMNTINHFTALCMTLPAYITVYKTSRETHPVLRISLLSSVDVIIFGTVRTVQIFLHIGYVYSPRF